jgi:hypothetical protein
MKNKIIIVLIAVVITAGFLYWTLTPPSIFNFIPFSIHQAFFKKVTENGEVINIVSENSFIKLFDVFISLIVFWITYKLSKLLLT